MADEIRVGRPVTPGMRMDGGEMQSSGGGRRGSNLPWVVLAVIVIVLIVLGVLFRDKLFGGQKTADTTTPSGYQAVFLTNGQVYFGKLTHVGEQYATLEDIYYLQVTNPPLQGAGAQQPAQQQQPQLS